MNSLHKQTATIYFNYFNPEKQGYLPNNKPLKTKPKAVDLFSGCGGLTLGLKRAGFEVIGAVEIDGLAAKSYLANHGDVVLFQRDICKLPAASFLRSLHLAKGELDLLAGCPPCQGFSTMTTLNGKKNNEDDQRNDLVFEFLRFVRVLRPKTLMMENVPGLHSDQRKNVLVKKLKQMGYCVTEGVIDASDYGVPQRRKRFILLGARMTAVGFSPTMQKRMTVRQAFAKLIGVTATDPLHDINFRRVPRIQRLIELIPKDGGSRKELPQEYRLKCHKKFNGFNDVYGRMKWDDVAPTITTGCINPSKGRFIHPAKNRCITLREAAILQGFPKSYKFSLAQGKYAVAKLIGNAVPPKLSQLQAAALKTILSTIPRYKTCQEKASK